MMNHELMLPTFYKVSKEFLLLNKQDSQVLCLKIVLTLFW